MNKNRTNGETNPSVGTHKEELPERLMKVTFLTCTELDSHFGRLYTQPRSGRRVEQAPVAAGVYPNTFSLTERTVLIAVFARTTRHVDAPGEYSMPIDCLLDADNSVRATSSDPVHPVVQSARSKGGAMVINPAVRIRIVQ